MSKILINSQAVLASLIIVALQGLILQVKKVVTFWRLSKWDFTVWMFTFVTTITFGIDIGLGVGLATAIFSIFIRGYTPYTCLLGVVPKTDLYLDLNRFKGVQEVPFMKVFHYSGSLNFASRASFKRLLFRRLQFDPLKLNRKLNEGVISNSNLPDTKCVIIDFSSLIFLDPSGADLLYELQTEFQRLGISLYIASCSRKIKKNFL